MRPTCSPTRLLAVLGVVTLVATAPSSLAQPGSVAGNLRQALEALDLEDAQRTALRDLTREIRTLPRADRRDAWRDGLTDILTQAQRRALHRSMFEVVEPAPTPPRDGIVHGELDASTLARFRDAATYSAARRGVSMVVLLEGRLVFEDYPNGGAVETAHALASGTKSFSCVLATLAVEDGLLKLDEPLSTILTSWRDDPLKATITTRQLLHLTSGLETSVGRPPAYADAIDRPVVSEPGSSFAYGSTAFQVFGDVLRRRLAATSDDDSVLAYLQQRIFDPIGIEPASWRLTGGQPNLPSGAALTARDWATFGELIRRDGRVDGRDDPVLDSETLANCFEGSTANPGYGLGWWLNRRVADEQRQAIPQLTAATDLAGADSIPPDVVMAAGAGDQRLYVVPSAELVVVRQTDAIAEALRGRRFGWSDVDFLSRLLGGVDRAVTNGSQSSAGEPSR